VLKKLEHAPPSLNMLGPKITHVAQLGPVVIIFASLIVPENASYKWTARVKSLYLYLYW